MNIIDELSLLGIVPVVAIDDAKDAGPLADALCKGGLPCAEVTFRTSAAEEAIKIMTRAHPEMIVGAGTVLTAEQADRATVAGARFIVSPGLNPDVVKHCISRGYPVVPGCATPSDIECALSLGLDTVKFFPAEAAGGIAMIKAMSAPYGKVRFMPTGGINAANLNDYLSFPKVFACGGSWMVKKDLINNGEFDKITRLTEEAIASMLSLKIRGVTLAGESSVPSLLSGVFPQSSDREIVLSTKHPDRAAYHLTKQGFMFDESFVSVDPVSGFKVRLVKE